MTFADVGAIGTSHPARSSREDEIGGRNGNGHKPVTPPGQTVSAVAKNGGGPVGVLTTLTGLKPYSRGLPNALEHVTVNHAPPGP